MSKRRSYETLLPPAPTAPLLSSFIPVCRFALTCSQSMQKKRALRPLPSKGERDVENKENAPINAVVTKKAKKLFNAIQMPEDITGDPFAT
eukprot:766905-Hanusia_phi.AAC.4